MATLDFPDAPTLGQIYSKWTWNGTMWVVTPVTGPAGPPAGRNLLHNGTFSISQRNSSVGIGPIAVPAGLGNYTDRWALYSMVNNTNVYPAYVNSSNPGQKAMVVDSVAVGGVSPGASNYGYVRQAIEGVNLQHLRFGSASAKALTLSFWVMTTSAFTGVVELKGASGRNISALYTSPGSGVWTKITIVFPGDTGGPVIANDNVGTFQVQFWLAAGTDYQSTALQTTWGATTATGRATGQSNLWSATNKQFWISQVQLEVGSVATPFEERDYSSELAMCQRYLHVDNQEGGLYHTFGFGFGDTTATAKIQYNFPVTMRAIPLVSQTGGIRLYEPGVGVFPATVVDPGSGQMGLSGGMIRANVPSGVTINRAYFLQANNDAGARLIYAAEI